MHQFGNDVKVEHGRVTLANEAVLQTDAMDELVREAVFGQGQTKDHAQWLLWEIGQAAGVGPSSIHDLYLARGRGETHGFTVPAINVRGMAYDTARAVFRTAVKRAPAHSLSKSRDRKSRTRISARANTSR